MLSLIRNDLRRKAQIFGLRPGPLALVRMLFSDGTTAQVLYRMTQYCHNHHLKPVAFLLYRINHLVGHCVIGRGADFGPGLAIMHSVGLVVNTRVRAGANIILEHGVTIGDAKGRVPELGDNVFVGAGAKVIGGVHVGSDVKIGANAVVVHDVPDGATVVGIPGRVVRMYGKRLADAMPSAPNDADVGIPAVTDER